ncbi:MAG: hypothetical protein AAB354_05490 [candidate division KSB1 bacterium]
MKILPRSDSALQLSRRLDWRFLLPEPSLRRVAYFGAAQNSLAQALQHFSETLSLFAPEEAAPAPHAARFDLVVLAEPTFAQLEAAVLALAPGGYVYAEVQRAWDWRRADKLPTRALSLPKIADWQDALARLGCVEIKAHWHRPTFEAAVQIIPLHDAGAMDFVFNRRAEDLVSRLKFATGRSLMKQAWLARLLQCVSLVARKG